jgi:hypothetical protein
MPTTNPIGSMAFRPTIWIISTMNQATRSTSPPMKKENTLSIIITWTTIIPMPIASAVFTIPITTIQIPIGISLLAGAILPIHTTVDITCTGIHGSVTDITTCTALGVIVLFIVASDITIGIRPTTTMDIATIMDQTDTNKETITMETDVRANPIPPTVEAVFLQACLYRKI